MWGRVTEMMTAVWIAFSPFIFRAADNSTIMWADNLFALAIIILSSLSFWKPMQYAHIGIFGVALGMVLWGRFSSSPPIPAHQNHIFIGFFLMMIALIPNNASRPPRVWRTPVGSVDNV